MANLFLLLIVLSHPVYGDIATPSFGISYSSSKLANLSQLNQPNQITGLIGSLGISRLRLHNPTPGLIKQFVETNITLLLSLTSKLIQPFAVSRGRVRRWIYHHIPAYDRPKILMVSISAEGLEAVNDFLMLAMENMYDALREFEVYDIAVSATVALLDIIHSPFTPAAHFKEEFNMKPLLKYLWHTNSSLILTVHSPQLYLGTYPMVKSFALLHKGGVCGVFFWKDIKRHGLFSATVDAVYHAMKVLGYEKLPIVLAEAGCPRSTVDANDSKDTMESIFNQINAKNESNVREIYIYDLVDDDKSNENVTAMKQVANFIKKMVLSNIIYVLKSHILTILSMIMGGALGVGWIKAFVRAAMAAEAKVWNKGGSTQPRNDGGSTQPAASQTGEIEEVEEGEGKTQTGEIEKVEEAEGKTQIGEIEKVEEANGKTQTGEIEVEAERKTQTEGHRRNSSSVTLQVREAEDYPQNVFKKRGFSWNIRSMWKWNRR